MAPLSALTRGEVGWEGVENAVGPRLCLYYRQRVGCGECRLRGLLVVPACQEVCEAREVSKMDGGILFVVAARRSIEEKMYT